MGRGLCILFRFLPLSRVRIGRKGFVVNRTRSDRDGRIQHEIDPLLAGSVFYWDAVHPDGQTGHKFMGEISAQASRSVRCFAYYSSHCSRPVFRLSWIR